VPSEEPRWDPRLDRDPHRAHPFFSTPDGRRTYLVEQKATVGVTARLDKMLGKVHWSVIPGRRRRNAERNECWLRELPTCMAELEAEYKADCDLGLPNGSGPSDYAARVRLFYKDRRKNPEHWKAEYLVSEPDAKLEHAAAVLIEAGIKSLQNA
jgi:hypothetical protein